MRRAIVTVFAAAITSVLLPQAASAAPFPAAEVQPGIVYACVTTTTGEVRLPKPKTVNGKSVVQCRRAEELRSWSSTGASGQPGAPGQQGPQGPAGSGGSGPAGPAGANGAPGRQGPEGPQGPQGPQGPAGPAGAAGSSAVPNVLATYKSPAPGNNLSLTTTAQNVLNLNSLTDGYYLVSFEVGVQSTGAGDVSCMLTGGLMNGGVLSAGDLVNNATLVFSPKGTVSGTFPVQIMSGVLGSTISVSCRAASTGTASGRSITATPIANPTFRF